MSQSARATTEITDLAAAKKAIENLGWGYYEASDKNLGLEIEGTRNLTLELGRDSKYSVTGNFDGLGQSAIMEKLNVAYAKVKLFKEIHSRSDHGITDIGEATILSDGSIEYIGEIDASVLVG